MVFWVQIGYISQNSYYKDDNTDFVQAYKSAEVLGGSFNDATPEQGELKSFHQRERAATQTIYTSLNQILPTTLDTFVLFLFTTFNILVV